MKQIKYNNTSLMTYWVLFVGLLFASASRTHANTLEDISFAALSGDKVQITLRFSDTAPEPQTFTTDDPARISVDFSGVSSTVDDEMAIGVGVADSISTIETADRLRVVINLSTLVPFNTDIQGNHITFTLENAISFGSSSTVEDDSIMSQSDLGGGVKSITNVDFRRGEGGEGRVMVTMSDPSTIVDIRQEGGQVVVIFIDTKLPNNLSRRLDVTDFATPVQFIDTAQDGRSVRMAIRSIGEYEHLAYQAENSLVIEFKEISKEEQEVAKKRRFTYTGERLSLNFQDISVRAVLQLLADFTDLNMVTSDTVAGNLTLRLNNVPWDQALDIILKTKGLSMRKTGNVILVAPTEEIAAREKLELESNKQIEELAPLRSEFITLNYAKAESMADLLKSEENNFLSERGSVTVDERTNTLLIQDVATNLEDIRDIIDRLDVPVRQVLIETRIISATEGFTKDLGVRLSVAGNASADEHSIGIGGGVPGDLVTDINGDGEPDPIFTSSNAGEDGAENLLLDFAASNANGIPGALNITVRKGFSHLLRLELSALQTDSRGEVIASPRLVTADQHTAVIKSGEEIGYLEASSSGAATVSFKEAVLKLEVTPHITPDDRILMDLNIHQDQRTGDVIANVPVISTKEMNTQVLVDNGETVILGGIYQRNLSESENKIPVLGDLPYLGWMFRKQARSDNQEELLLFITPKILKETLGL